MSDLEKTYEAHNKLYERGEEILSDDEYDALESYMKKDDSNETTLKKVGATATPGIWEKKTHAIPMGSLSKARDMSELKDWWVKTEKAFNS